MTNCSRVLVVAIVAQVCFVTVFAQFPKREFRGAWIATVTNLDWPTRGASTQTQKNELTTLLDDLYDAGFNAVVFQVRPECDALYDSPYEPWSYWLTGSQGTPPNPYYDPLAFAVEEAHRRGMEIHAWFNPYRAYRENNVYSAAANHVTNAHPEWILTSPDGYKILNPGLPDVRDFVTTVISDVVRRYDVDGVHMDDYFYPYPSHGFTTEDSATFRLYRRGFADDQTGEWRRDNVNMLIRQMYDSVQVLKPWVKVGMSPFGIWKPGVPPGILTVALNAYETIYCDPIAWLQDGSIDYLTPQLYWGFGGGTDYGLLQQWWSDSVAAHSRHFYPGLGTYRNSAAEIARQIDTNRWNPNVHGSVQFRARFISLNSGGIADQLRLQTFRYGAAVPDMGWKETIPPEAPMNLSVVTDPGSGIGTLTWDPPAAATDGDSASRYLVYRFPFSSPPGPSDLEEGKNIMRVHGTTSFTPSSRIDTTNASYSFAVSALDKNNNEGPISGMVTITAPVAAPPLIAPLDDEPYFARTTKLVWNTTPPAMLYRVQVSRDSLFQPDSLVLDRYLTDTSTTVSGLDAQRWYAWRVMSGSQGGTSSFTEARTFRTGWPHPPTIISPNIAVNVVHNPTYTWSGTGATSYRLQVRDDVTKALVLNVVTSDSSYVQTSPLLSYRIYTWTVTAINSSGESDPSAEGRFRTRTGTSVADESGLPDEYSLAYNYPNPFNATTQVQFSLPESGPISLRVFNVLGQEVAIILDRPMPAGVHVAHFNAGALPSGTYVAVMTTEGGRFSRKMILMK